MISAGAAVDDVRGVFGSARLRYFGPRPLIEDNSVRSEATAIVNLQAGYKVTPRVRFLLDIFNLFDAEDSDIDYYYASRLPGEPGGGVEDIHFHPTIPFTARLGIARRLLIQHCRLQNCRIAGGRLQEVKSLDPSCNAILQSCH